MVPLVTPPKLKLSRLRDIGWTIWDPIGLLAPSERWDEGEALAFADEYDNYLREAAGLLRRGTPAEDVVRLLVAVETSRMGLAERPDTVNRARLSLPPPPAFPRTPTEERATSVAARGPKAD
ncbi:hypothetical protein [Rhizobium halophytocola]|uniref:Uncharacterized protein n=1 Tax=Rhizobium halophytocola TaxID=735519 RepID=A0ABS4DTK9_9HYPH|nr:hypothetical protein [Rhizobium halophytocola]MBP1849043.1 hypothetical protein [Rhizobium halophytocola]